MVLLDETLLGNRQKSKVQDISVEKSPHLLAFRCVIFIQRYVKWPKCLTLKNVGHSTFMLLLPLCALNCTGEQVYKTEIIYGPCNPQRQSSWV